MVQIDPFGSFAQGANLQRGINQQRANVQAATGLASGNYAQALGALGGVGDFEGVARVQDRQQTQQTQQRGQQLASTLQIVRSLKAIRDGGGDVTTAIPQYRPALLAMGTDPAQLQQIEQQIASNPAFLDQIEQITATQQAEWEFRDGGAGDVVAVRQGSNGPESRLVYDAPDRPISTPYGIILPPQSRTPVATGTQPAPGANGMPAVTGAAVSGGPLWSRQEQQESGGNQAAVSPVGAFGVAQLMPGTAADLARQMGVTPEQLRSDERLNRRAGQMYMDQQLNKYGGNEALALAAYNAGPGRVDEWIQRFGDPRTGEITTEEWVQRIPYRETQNYVQNITNGQYGGGEVAQGDGGQSDPAQDLGGGWSLQSLQTPADVRAGRAETRAERAEARAQAAFERSNARVADLTPQEVAAAGLPEGTVAQRRADGSINVVSRGGSERYTEGQRGSAAFAFRLRNAAQSLDNLAQNGVARPSPAILAFGDGRVRENALSSTDRRWLQAAREWLAPVLRKDTGAAVGPGELVTYMGIYLPSPTDDAATLQQKAQARAVAEQALRAQAGGAYAEMFPQAANSSRPSQPRTNAPGLRFNISEQQLATRQRIIGEGARPSARLGTTQNPRYINPSAATTSYNNIPRGEYYVAPDGQLRRKG